MYVTFFAGKMPSFADLSYFELVRRATEYIDTGCLAKEHTYPRIIDFIDKYAHSSPLPPFAPVLNGRDLPLIVRIALGDDLRFNGLPILACPCHKTTLLTLRR